MNLPITDYNTLTAEEIAAFANEGNEAIQIALLSVMERARSIGQVLIVQKARVPHGNWKPWIVKNLTFSERTACNYMAIAQTWEDLEKLAPRCEFNLEAMPYNQGVKLAALLKGSINDLSLNAKNLYKVWLHHAIKQIEEEEISIWGQPVDSALLIKSFKSVSVEAFGKFLQAALLEFGEIISLCELPRDRTGVCFHGDPLLHKRQASPMGSDRGTGEPKADKIKQIIEEYEYKIETLKQEAKRMEIDYEQRILSLQWDLDAKNEEISRLKQYELQPQ